MLKISKLRVAFRYRTSIVRRFLKIRPLSDSRDQTSIFILRPSISVNLFFINMAITVIAGLGNPGLKYRNTRHNIGFDVVQSLSSELGATWAKSAKFEADIAEARLSGRKILLVKPLTYMNDSGRSLGAILRFYKFEPANLLVVYDDITLDIGRAKLRVQGSAGGHNGVTDLLEKVGSGFARYRIGIGAKPSKEMDLAEYVLSTFKPAEREILADRMKVYREQIMHVAEIGVDSAFNTINQRTSKTHERNHNE